MSIPLTINGVTINYPQQFDTNWGPPLTNWATLVTSGMLQTSGVNAATLIKSATSNPAQSGMLRLAKTDVLAWRNNANSGDVSLGINGSDNLSYNGSPINIASGGTANTSFTAYAVLCGGVTSTGGLQNVSGVGMAGQSLVSNGAGMLPTWQTVTGTGTVNPGTSGQIAYYASSGSTIDGSPVLTYTGPSTTPILTLQNAGSGHSTFTIISNNAGTDSVINLESSSLTNALASDSNGNFLLSDNDNNITFLEYLRSAPKVVFATLVDMGSNKITGLTNGSASSDAVTFNQLTTGNAITAGGIANHTITATQIANNTITATQIANNTITAAQILNNTITATQIASGTITGTQITSSVALGGNPTTTTPSSNDNSTKIATTAFVNPANSLSSSGYQKLASGLILQWGPIPLTNGSGTDVTINFPLTFPNNVWSLQSQSADIGTGNGHDCFHLKALSTSQFTLRNNDNTTAFTGYWFAVGN